MGSSQSFKEDPSANFPEVYKQWSTGYGSSRETGHVPPYGWYYWQLKSTVWDIASFFWSLLLPNRRLVV